MTGEKNIDEKAVEMRKLAETKAAQYPNDKTLSPVETQQVLHELRVHQIELEMQNDELRKSQAELEAARVRYFELYDLAPAGYCTVSEKGLVLEANLTVSTLLSEPRDSLVKRPFSQFILKEDQDIYYLHHKQLLKSAEPQSFDLRMLKKDGTAFWANLAATVAEDPLTISGQATDGTPVCRIVISDITEHKKAENIFLRMAQEWQRTFDSMNEAVWILDKDSMVLRSNKVAERYFHKPCAEMVGKHCWEIVHGTAQPIHECPTMRVRKSLHHESVELQIGEDWFVVTADPILDADGKFDGVVHIVTNITGRKRAEEEKVKLETQLRQSQKLESIGQLAGGVAHDFNNMLSVINGYSEITLMKLPQSDPNYSGIMEIHKAGQRSADLTKQLLAFARRQTIDPKVLNMNDAVSGMIVMLRRLIGENIELLWKPDTNLWKVKMDPSQINQILANLLVNARDSISGDGKIIIETGKADLDQDFCRDHPASAPGQYVVLSVSDTGCGMSREALGHIFEPFFTTKKVGEGTGLGLATVFGIVKQNNGFINVYSEPGKGTTFKIYLPRTEALEIEERLKIGKMLTGTETVLLVEDEESLLRIAKIQLDSLGYNVLAASSPEQAISIAGEYKGEIHLLMTDVVMPEMSGRVLRDRITSTRPGIKCLFMSGYTADVIANNGVLEAGINFLEKPFTVEDLSVKLRKALS